MNLSLRKYYSGLAIIALLALSHQLLQKQFQLSIPFLHAYLDDVLSMPLFLALWNWERAYFWNKNFISKSEIILFTLFIFFLFEGIIPQYIPTFTADWTDGLAYALGSGIFWWLQDIERNSLTLQDGKENT